MNKYFFLPKILILLNTLLVSSIVNTAAAHTIEKSHADLRLLPNNQYTLTLTIDVIHLAKDGIDFKGTDTELIDTLEQLSLLESKRLLDNIRQSIQKNSVVYFNDKPSNLPTFSGLSVAEFKHSLTSINNYHLPITLTGTMPINSQNMAFRFAPELGNVVLTISKPTKYLISTAVKSQTINITSTTNVNNDASTLNTFVEYLYQGIVHIVPKGLDHILFVLALFLLARKTSTLLWQVSAFTLAHTITLALGIFNVVSLPSEIVEPLISLSIAYIAIENIYQKKLTRWRLPLIFAFGLLHGLGFASVLLELGLQQQQFITSLVAFNIGVEFGQLSVVLAAFAMLGWFYKKDWYQQRIVTPLSLLIAVVGLYWFVERII